MAMGTIHKQLDGIKMSEVLAKVSELGKEACAKQELKAMHVHIYKGASACGTLAWFITDVLHGEFMPVNIDGHNDEASLFRTLRCDDQGQLTQP